jgi:hypothetical protein
MALTKINSEFCERTLYEFASSRLIGRSEYAIRSGAQLLCILRFIADYEETGEGGIRTLGERGASWEEWVN